MKIIFKNKKQELKKRLYRVVGAQTPEQRQKQKQKQENSIWL